jgi:hypothetical protein
VVTSETFFTFTWRRLKEAQNVLLDLVRHRPSNFGISTALIMHLIWFVCYTPVAKKGYLHDALRDVQFEEIMSDYGMFFLHNLDLENHCIHAIPPRDPDTCMVAMSLSGKLPKPLAPFQPLNLTPTGHYPLGECPAWSEIKAFIGRGVGIFLKEWVWDQSWEEEDNTASRLFTIFTREYCTTLKHDALWADSPSPISLEDAMRAWTTTELSLMGSLLEHIT